MRPRRVSFPASSASRSPVTALERVAGPDVSALIDWVPDPAVARLVTSWPARIRADRAERLGLTQDPDFGSIVGRYLAESQD